MWTKYNQQNTLAQNDFHYVVIMIINPVSTEVHISGHRIMASVNVLAEP